MTPFDSCSGVVPLRPLLANWMRGMLRYDVLAPLVGRYGSPLNLHDTAPFVANMAAFRDVGTQRGLTTTPYFARKADKCLGYVAAAQTGGFGVDCASMAEVEQALNLGVAPHRIVCTAAIKPAPLMQLCVGNGVPVMLDNDDELTLASDIASAMEVRAPVGLRVSGFRHQGETLHSRFGYPAPRLPDLISRIHANSALTLEGLHFHLAGYDATQRVSALDALLTTMADHPGNTDIRYIDIGGGIPMRYLEYSSQWDHFHRRHAEALTGDADPIT